MFGVPVFVDMTLTDQDVWLFLVSIDGLAFIDIFQRIHSIPTLVIERQMPVPMRALLAFQRRANSFFKEVAMAPGFMQENEVRAARSFFQRIGDVAVWIDLQHVEVALSVHANV